MIRFPPYLKIGDTIGLVCPAGYMPFEKTEKCIAELKQWGYNIKMGSTVGTQFNYFSGTDEDRLDDLQKMMNDEEVQAILCARGGYGTGRIIDQINFKKFRRKPKWIIGFSDISVLHAHLFSKYKIASLHAPMAGAFNVEESNEFLRSLQNVLSGGKSNYVSHQHPSSRVGKCKGRLIGGNLSLVAHLIGTSSDYNTKGKILFLEDIGEYIYNVDRMMYQLKRSGKLKDLAGLIIGGFTDMKDTAVPFGQSAEEVIRAVVKEYKYPVCFGFPVSHEKENYALKVGGKYELIVGEHLSSLLEE